MIHREPIALEDLVPYPVFSRECERAKTATRGQLQWWLRYRNDNGLVATGAVIEKRPTPGTRRPTLIINRAKFIAWLSTSDARAA